MKYIAVTIFHDAGNVEAVNDDKRTTISDFHPLRYALYEAAQIALTLELPFVVSGYERNPNDIENPKEKPHQTGEARPG